MTKVRLLTSVSLSVDVEVTPVIERFATSVARKWPFIGMYPEVVSQVCFPREIFVTCQTNIGSFFALRHYVSCGYYMSLILP